MKTSPITFCGSSVEQIIDHPTKTFIVDSIRQLIELTPDARTSRIMRSIQDATFLRNPHIMTLATRGQRCWMYLTQVNHQNVCILIERSIKPGYPFPKMLAVNYQFNDTLHQNTLLEVEVINDAGGCDAPLILWTDLLVLKNRDVRNWDPIRRFNVMHTILEKQYHENMVLQPCTLQIKRLFTSTDWNEMLRFVKELPYVSRGLVFYPLNTRYPMRLWLDDKEELLKADDIDGCTNSDTAGALKMNPDTHLSYSLNRHRYRGKGKGKGKGNGFGKGRGKGKGKGKGKGTGITSLPYSPMGNDHDSMQPNMHEHPMFNGSDVAPLEDPFEGMGSSPFMNQNRVYFPLPSETNTSETSDQSMVDVQDHNNASTVVDSSSSEADNASMQEMQDEKVVVL